MAKFIDMDDDGNTTLILELDDIVYVGQTHVDMLPAVRVLLRGRAEALEFQSQTVDEATKLLEDLGAALTYKRPNGVGDVGFAPDPEPPETDVAWVQPGGTAQDSLLTAGWSVAERNPDLNLVKMVW